MTARETVFAIIKYTFMLNLAIGFIYTLFPIMATVGTGVAYNDSYSSYFETEMSKDINPEGLLEDKTDATSRVFDMLNLGLLGKIAKTIKHYLYGSIDFIHDIFGGFMEETFHNFFFGMLYTLMTLGYIWAIWSLLTGTNE